MSQEHYIAKLLEMEEAIIENVEKTDRFTYICFHLPVREAVCPRCGALTHRIHNYCVKIRRDLLVQEKPVRLKDKRRRLPLHSMRQGFSCNQRGVKKSRNHLRATMEYASSEVAKIWHTVADALEHINGITHAFDKPIRVRAVRRIENVWLSIRQRLKRLLKLRKLDFFCQIAEFIQLIFSS